MKNIHIEVEISRDQVDWLNLLKEKLTQVNKDLNFYNNILREFIAKDIVSLGLDSRGNIIQESSAVMTTTNATVTADITVDAVILDDVSVVNDSCAWHNNQHE